MSLIHPLTEPEIQFIESYFAKFYNTKFSEVMPPKNMEEREFGFTLFREGIMIRHLSFQDVEELRRFLKDKTPKDFYYSCAYYERPKEEMDNKGWLGADLIFDIDADHILTPCKKSHDYWLCRDCGYDGRGGEPSACPRCGRTKISVFSWPCEVCLESAKREMIKLVEFMMDDFGFSSNELAIYFSGHRGYHLHVESEVIKEVGQNERKEVVDYLQAIGIDLKFHWLLENGTVERGTEPMLDEGGWRGRIARGTYEFLLRPTLLQDLSRLGLSRQAISQISKNKNLIIESWKSSGPWKMFKGLGLNTWRKVAYEALKNQAVSVDSVVTTDIHRLIRMGGTLHGKTGFKKAKISLIDLERFDPLNDAVAFEKGYVKIHILQAPKFVLMNETYGPYENCKAEVPIALAILLLCKGFARLENGV
ncbi:MAG: DNA primase small subunit PriS [Candidatus Bathyarchaeia archaeon]